MARPISGIYQHIATGNLYDVVGVGRAVEAPTKQMVIYAQRDEAILRGTDTMLPSGYLWTRDLDDFVKKFVPVKSP